MFVRVGRWLWRTWKDKCATTRNFWAFSQQQFNYSVHEICFPFLFRVIRGFSLFALSHGIKSPINVVISTLFCLPLPPIAHPRPLRHAVIITSYLRAKYRPVRNWTGFVNQLIYMFYWKLACGWEFFMFAFLVRRPKKKQQHFIAIAWTWGLEKRKYYDSLETWHFN